MKVVTATIQRQDTPLSVNKDSIATLITAKMLGAYNQQLSALRYVNGLILAGGGAKDDCIGRFAASKDSVTPQVIRKKSISYQLLQMMRLKIGMCQWSTLPLSLTM